MNHLIPWRKKTEVARSRAADEYPLQTLQREMNDLFDNLFGDWQTRWPGAHAQESMLAAPRVDVAETDDAVQVTAELPGMDEKDVQVTLDHDILTIKGEKKAEREEKKKNYHLVERSFGEFHRAIALPAGLDAEKVKAVFKRGVLTVNLPKLPEARSPQKKIEISSD